MLAEDESTAIGSITLPSAEKQQEQEKEEERPCTDAQPVSAGETGEEAGVDTFSSTMPSLSHHHSSVLSKVQVQAVDEAFERIFGYPWGTHFELPAVLTHEQRMLVKIFGPEGTAALFASLGPRTQRRRASAMRLTRPRPSSAAATAAPSQRQSIEKVPKLATSPAAEPRDTAQPSHHDDATDPMVPPPPIQSRGGGGGVDRLLSELSGKPAVSTLSKTSTDWESFKTTSGLGDAIEEKAQSKDSYLNRQDFLTRVDHRRFEVEKQERDRERAQRGV